MKSNNLTFTFHRFLSKIPEGYDGKNVIFMEREIIYNHEVVKKYYLNGENDNCLDN